MTNDELLAEAAKYDVGFSPVELPTAGLIIRLAAALRAEQADKRAWSDLYRQRDTLKTQLAAAENVIREALDVLNLEPSYNTESNIARAHDLLSSYKPEEGKN